MKHTFGSEAPPSPLILPSPTPLSVCLSVHRSLSLCLTLCLCLSLSTALSVSVSVCLSVRLSVSLPPCLSLSVCLSVSVVPSLSVCLSLSPSQALSPPSLPTPIPNPLTSSDVWYMVCAGRSTGYWRCRAIEVWRYWPGIYRLSAGCSAIISGLQQGGGFRLCLLITVKGPFIALRRGKGLGGLPACWVTNEVAV